MYGNFNYTSNTKINQTINSGFSEMKPSFCLLTPVDPKHDASLDKIILAREK